MLAGISVHWVSVRSFYRILLVPHCKYALFAFHNLKLSGCNSNIKELCVHVCCWIIYQTMQGPIKSLVLLWEWECSPVACMCVHAGHAPPSNAVKCVLSLTRAPLDISWIPDRQTKGTAQLGWGEGMMEALGQEQGPWERQDTDQN